MSLEITHSHNNMTPLEEETADEKIQFIINPPLPRIYDSTGDTKTFHKFGDLPAELQIKIFKHAMPAARVVRWTRNVIWRSSDTSFPMFNLRLFPSLFSLLNTCLVSNQSVHHDGGFVRIKWTCGKGSIPAYLTEWPHKHDTFVYYNYLRPNHDIFLLDYEDLIEAHLIDGSINLQSFTHLVLYGNYRKYPRFKLVKLLEFIQTHCPNIKRVSFVVSFVWFRSFNRYAIVRFIDIDRNLLKLKLWYSVRTKIQNPEASTCFKISLLLNEASGFMSEFDAVYNKMDGKSMAFWKNVQVVPVLDGGSQNPFDDSELYIPYLKAYACSNDDGTLQTLTCEWKRSGVLRCSEPS